MVMPPMGPRGPMLPPPGPGMMPPPPLPMGGMMGGMGMPGMAPPMPLPPPMPPPPDPLSDPAVVQALLAEFEADQKDAKPKRAKWQEPPKPKREQMLAKARKDEAAHAGLVARFAEDIAYLHPGEAVGIFGDFDETAEVPWVSSALADEEDLVVAIVGGIDVAYEADARTTEDRDEAQDKQDFLYACREEALRQHARRGGGSRQLEEVRFVRRYGRIVTRTVMNLESEPDEIPFRMHLIDPATVFPTWEGDRGLATVTRIYRQTVAELVGDHDDAKGAIEKKLVDGRGDDGKFGRKYDWDDEVEVIEYWDRKWVAVFAAERLVKGPVAHDYGEPPFVVTLVARGDPAVASNPDGRGARTRSGAYVTGRQADAAAKGQSFFHNRKITHAQREAMFGRLFTEFKKQANQPIIVEQDEFAYEKGVPEISRAEGAVNPLWAPHEKASTMPTAPLPATFGPLFAASNEDVARSAMPPAAYGISSNANQSGHAMEGMNESGRDKMTPDILALEEHHAMVAEQILRFYRDWGRLLGPEGERGGLYVPRRRPRPNQDPWFRLTPEAIRRTGTRVRCTMTSIRLQNLAQLGNAMTLWRQLGAVTRYDTIKLSGLPGARDPLATMREIDIESLKEMPEYRLGALLKYLVEEQQDPALAEFVFQQLTKAQQRGAAPPPGQSGPGGPPSGGPAMTPGMSLPGLNQPPGPGSGPQGPMGPPPGGPGMEL